MPANPTLYCPIRGPLKVSSRTKDGLSFSEEKRRIDSIRFLLEKNYPVGSIKIESTLIKFGNSGRNSFRTDLVVFKESVKKIDSLNLEDQRELIFLIGEIKRDNKEAEVAKKVQVRAAMGFLPDLKSIGMYWDDLEQKIFYRQLRGTKQRILEAPLAYLPDYLSSVNVTKLRYQSLQKSPTLVGLFKKIEDALHPYITDLSERYELLLQLLLVKIFDESAHLNNTSEPMFIQDFSLFEDADDDAIVEIFSSILNKSLNLYQKYLPKPVKHRINVSGAALRKISELLAPIKLLESNPEVMQDFYMFFAKQLYKWDLAQYFTPYEVVDFIVRITNPQFGDIIKDPACGSADFLLSSLRQGLEKNINIGDSLYGVDNSINAVQISVLNMLLNGDGKSNIKQEDSLMKVAQEESKFDVMLCNPPFGVKITEKRPQVLEEFALGRGQDAQQTGILFAELVIRQAKPGGRMAIILPNGYLGNKSETYRKLREWILMQTKIVCIIAFPRFTFKKSGADVSASVLVLEKRQFPLADAFKSEDYPIYVNQLESVGWDIGKKKAEPIYKRNLYDGTLLLDQENQPTLDADFAEILNDLYNSPVSEYYPWIVQGLKTNTQKDGWFVPLSSILESRELLLDPKRFSKKYIQTVERISNKPHFHLLEVCELIPEGWRGKQNDGIYRYIELNNVNDMAYDYQELRGWQLPGRAKHMLERGDLLVGAVWGSVSKWFIADSDAEDGRLIATNGFYRLKLKKEKKDLLPDLIFGLSSEFYRVQMRALATGSDGLAVIPEEDLRHVILPHLPETIKAEISQSGPISSDLAFIYRSKIRALRESIYSDLIIPPRKSNFSQV